MRGLPLCLINDLVGCFAPRKFPILLTDGYKIYRIFSAVVL